MAVTEQNPIHPIQLKDSIGSSIGNITSISASAATATTNNRSTQICTIGTIIKVPSLNHTAEDHTTGSFIFASVRSIDHHAGSNITLELDFLGELTGDKFSRGLKHFPKSGSDIFPVTQDELKAIYAPNSDNFIPIGTVYPSDDVVAGLDMEKLLSRHFAILGSTGSGKSCAVSLMIHRIVERSPKAHVLILDPHGEYAHAFADTGVHFTSDTLSLPYWLMNFEEHIEIFIGRDTSGRDSEIDILKRCLFEARKQGAKEHALSHLTVDTPIPYKLTDLLRMIETELGRLEKAEDIKPFLRLKGKIEELRADKRFSFMFSGLLVQDTLSSLVSQILRMPTNDHPVSTLDLSGVPPEIIDVVVSLLSRLVFDFAMWSTRSGNPMPLLLVCEEAHRYVPHASRRSKTQSARKSLERIAKEGRKYGVSLGLVSQRPADLSESVLSQCGTIIAMRMNNDKDRKYVESAMPDGSTHFLAALPSLQNRETIIVGEGVSCPIRVCLDSLPDHQRPASEDPNFTLSWMQDVDATTEIIDDTVTHWRRGS